MNLKDNADGTCNCRPLGNGCFFTDGYEGPCKCPCHSKPGLQEARTEGWQVRFANRFRFIHLQTGKVPMIEASPVEVKEFIREEIEEAERHAIKTILSATQEELQRLLGLYALSQNIPPHRYVATFNPAQLASVLRHALEEKYLIQHES